MDREIDLTSAGRDMLIAIIVRQQAIIAGLEKRIAQLEGPAKSGGSRRMPGLKPKAEGKPAQPKKPRKRRPHGFARARMTPTQRVEHVVEQCPDSGIPLSGGWTQRTREVIDLPQVPVQVTEHAYLARTCPQCQRCCVPTVQLEGVVMGKQRLGFSNTTTALVRQCVHRQVRVPDGLVVSAVGRACTCSFPSDDPVPLGVVVALNWQCVPPSGYIVRGTEEP